MIDRCHDLRLTSRTATAAALLVLCAGLCGCANVGDSFASSAFVDPAKYENFDCKQLETERKNLAVRTAELQGLIAKAETGTGGSVIGELAYRNDYISARASSKLAEETWQRNKCVASSPATATPAPAPAPAEPAPRKGHGSARSGTAIY
ncbi:twin-arginine translocation pathway signal [Bradyrhizobium sp.]